MSALMPDLVALVVMVNRSCTNFSKPQKMVAVLKLCPKRLRERERSDGFVVTDLVH